VTCSVDASSSGGGGGGRRPFLLTLSPDSTLSLNSLFHLKQAGLIPYRKSNTRTHTHTHNPYPNSFDSVTRASEQRWLKMHPFQTGHTLLFGFEHDALF
jgi:hypothetical protein